MNYDDSSSIIIIVISYKLKWLWSQILSYERGKFDLIKDPSFILINCPQIPSDEYKKSTPIIFP